MPLPKIAITLGDPAGIGPEITGKILSDRRLYRLCSPVVIGDQRLLAQFQPALRKFPCKFIHIPLDQINKLKPGCISAATGKAAYQSIIHAVGLALAKKVDAIVTAPISKEALHRAGVAYPGHTELLAHLCKCKKYAMLMVAGSLRTVMITRHVPLARVSSLITRKDIINTSLLVNDFLKRYFGIREPRLGICALNPHAGEQGLIGKEELSVIGPAVRALRKKGILATGPLPVDSAWMKLKKDETDMLVTMYHDQSMIGLKCLSPETVVNVTAGLPFVRTSPGHGTAFDIAGKNCADPRPMMEAVKLAALLSKKISHR